jgi:transposase
MEMLGKVRRMRYRDGLSRAEIARRTGLSRTTVKKWLRAAEAVLPRYRRGEAPGKLSAFKEVLVGALEADARRPKRERRTAVTDRHKGATHDRRNGASWRGSKWAFRTVRRMG